jgi:hypothetical protein
MRSIVVPTVRRKFRWSDCATLRSVLFAAKRLRAHTRRYFGLLLFIVLMPMFPPSIQTDILGLGQYIPLAITLFGLLLMGFGSTLAFLACTLTPPNAIRNAEVVVQQSSHYQQTIRSAS